MIPTHEFWRIADAWRGNLREVDDCILWIRQGLNGNRSVHMPTRLRRYRECLRRASEYAHELHTYGEDVYVHMKPCTR